VPQHVRDGDGDTAPVCIFFLGGTGGWVSLIVAAFVIFLVTVVAIDKIE
jgi:hypothetical protein